MPFVEKIIENLAGALASFEAIDDAAEKRRVANERVFSGRLRGLTPLLVAVARGDLGLTTALLDAGADAKRRYVNSLKPAADGLIVIDLGDGVRWDACVMEGAAALGAAAYFGRRELVDLFVARGASVTKDECWMGADGACALHAASRALHAAARGGQLELVKSKLATATDDEAAALGIKDKGVRRLMLCFAWGGSEAGVKWLVEEKGGGDALLATVNQNGVGVVHYAAMAGALSLVAWLVESKGVAIDALTYGKVQPIHFAAESGIVELMSWLMERGASINVANDNGWQAIHYACSGGHLEAARVLLDKGAAIDALSNTMVQPIHLAAKSGNVELVTLLLDRGASVNLADKENMWPIHYAAESGNVELVTLLLDRGASVNVADKKKMQPIHYAAQSGNVELVTLLIDRGASPTAVDSYMRLPTHIAGVSGHVPVICMLSLEHNVDLTARRTNTADLTYNSCFSYVQWDAENCLAMIPLFAAKKIEMADAVNDNRQTPFDWMIQNGRRDLLQRMHDAGVKLIDVRNYLQSKTVLMVSASTGDIDMVKWLLSIAGRSAPSFVALRDASGMSAFDYTYDAVGVDEGVMDRLRALLAYHSDEKSVSWQSPLGGFLWWKQAAKWGSRFLVPLFRFIQYIGVPATLPFLIHISLFDLIKFFEFFAFNFMFGRGAWWMVARYIYYCLASLFLGIYLPVYLINSPFRGPCIRFSNVFLSILFFVTLYVGLIPLSRLMWAHFDCTASKDGSDPKSDVFERGDCDSVKWRPYPCAWPHWLFLSLGVPGYIISVAVACRLALVNGIWANIRMRPGWSDKNARRRSIAALFVPSFWRDVSAYVPSDDFVFNRRLRALNWPDLLGVLLDVLFSGVDIMLTTHLVWAAILYLLLALVRFFVIMATPHSFVSRWVDVYEGIKMGALVGFYVVLVTVAIDSSVGETCAPGCTWRDIGDRFPDDLCLVSGCLMDAADFVQYPVPLCSSLSMVGDDDCDDNCYTAAALFDGADCEYYSAADLCAPGCSIEMVQNEECDTACDVPACLFDRARCRLLTDGWHDDDDSWPDFSGFCEEYDDDEQDVEFDWYDRKSACAVAGCFPIHLHNGVCDAACDNAACFFDLGECRESLLTYAAAADDVRDAGGAALELDVPSTAPLYVYIAAMAGCGAIGAIAVLIMQFLRPLKLNTLGVTEHDMLPWRLKKHKKWPEIKAKLEEEGIELRPLGATHAEGSQSPRARSPRRRGAITGTVGVITDVITDAIKDGVSDAVDDQH